MEFCLSYNKIVNRYARAKRKPLNHSNTAKDSYQEFERLEHDGEINFVKVIVQAKNG